MRTALTIAGSDSGGGAGIQADLKTFAAHGVYGTSAVTAVTAQNTRAVGSVFLVPPDIVAAQIRMVVEDFGADAVKIGMLGSTGNASAVAEALRRWRLPHVVLDTVLASSTGVPLLEEGGVRVLQDELMPLAEVVTMNTREAHVLTGIIVVDVPTARTAASRLHDLGARAAIVKGGHLDGPPVDVLYDGRTFTEFAGERIATRHTHGTGCTFAAAIAARLALGHPLAPAIQAAKAYVTRALAQAPHLGSGHGPLAHFPQ
ncbi:MAG: bifunctional hydroxymethylpyrimidine kinase/phosphomethylpyrimidine kinase [Acidobacteria bacterium]|nr:bifunctional hydroxymethylpyrimidine kinase/phosphomethylpyrimidine kinase [Acidobacteriota bacterium]